MALTRKIYDILIDTDGVDVELELTIIHGDQVRAERDLRKLGKDIPSASYEFMSHAAHHAMVRLKLTELRYAEWIDTVLALEYRKDDQGKPLEVPVDPTQLAAPSGPPSPSPSASAISTAG